MNWDDARVALASGHRVRRPHWVTRLYQWHGEILWDITVALARKCNEDGGADRTYQPSVVDTAAHDWVRA